MGRDNWSWPIKRGPSRKGKVGGGVEGGYGGRQRTDGEDEDDEEERHPAVHLAELVHVQRPVRADPFRFTTPQSAEEICAKAQRNSSMHIRLSGGRRWR